MFTVIPYALPLRVPYRWAKGEHHERRGLLVRLDLDGVVAWGEAAPAPHRAVGLPAYAGEARRLLEGLDPRHEAFGQQLDTRHPPARLRCGVMTAWLAARACRAGESLGAALGRAEHLGRPPAARVPVNGLVTEATPESAADRALELHAAGHGTLKVKCGDDREGDVARVRAIREALPEARLRLDANEAWPAAWSLRQLEAMAGFDVEYVEQPLPRTATPTEFAQLRARSPIPVALDESARDLDTIRQLLDAEAADVLILKSQRLGGPDRTLQAVRLAETAAVRCTVTASLETAVGHAAALHCAALLPEPIPPCGLGMARFFAHDVATGPVSERGWMQVPTAPGLGVTDVTPPPDP